MSRITILALSLVICLSAYPQAGQTASNLKSATDLQPREMLLAVVQQRICCECKGQNGPFRVEAPAFPPSEVCPGACAPNGGGWTGRASAGSCNATAQPPPEQASFDELLQHVSYSITHQGVDIWGNGDTMAQGEDLRQRLMAGQHPPQQARGHEVIRTAALASVQEAASATYTECHRHDAEMAQHLAYVCDKKRGYSEIQNKLNQNDFVGIRNSYFHLQDNDANRSLLFCYNATDIRNLVQLYCKAPTQPPKDKPPFGDHPK
jgi:hypothetical protein